MSQAIRVTLQGKGLPSTDGAVQEKITLPTTAWEFQFSASRPRSASSGRLKTKLEGTPVLLVKPRDGSTPLLLEALRSRLVLDEVLLEFAEADTPSLRLANARVVGVRQFTGVPVGQGDLRELEEISFTFERMTQGTPKLTITLSNDDFVKIRE